MTVEPRNRSSERDAATHLFERPMQEGSDDQLVVTHSGVASPALAGEPGVPIDEADAGFLDGMECTVEQPADSRQCRHLVPLDAVTPDGDQIANREPLIHTEREGIGDTAIVD